MAKTDKTLPFQVRALGKRRVMILDFQGWSRGLQKAVHDILRAARELFGATTQRNRHVMIDITGQKPKHAIAALRNLMVAQNWQMTLVEIPQV